MFHYVFITLLLFIIVHYLSLSFIIYNYFSLFLLLIDVYSHDGQLAGWLTCQPAKRWDGDPLTYKGPRSQVET